MTWLAAVLACSREPGGPPPETGPPADTDTDPVVDTDPPTPTGDTAEACTVSPPTGDPATIPLAGPCAPEVQIGSFAVTQRLGSASVTGFLLDVPFPYVPPRVGGDATCELRRRSNPFCDPACNTDEVCTPDDTSRVDEDAYGDCAVAPVDQELGCVTIGGLVADVATPSFWVPDPPFVPGALVELTVAADLVLHGVGVEPIATGGGWTLADGEDLPITWNDAGASLRSTVVVTLNVDQSGLEPVDLTCELPDTGEGALPAAMVSALLAEGVSGFPSATLTRRTADSAEVAGGCVDFVVGSTVDVPDVQVAP